MAKSPSALRPITKRSGSLAKGSEALALHRFGVLRGELVDEALNNRADAGQTFIVSEAIGIDETVTAPDPRT